MFSFAEFRQEMWKSCSLAVKIRPDAKNRIALPADEKGKTVCELEKVDDLFKYRKELTATAVRLAGGAAQLP